MSNQASPIVRFFRHSIPVVVLAAALGCDVQIEHYPSNRVHALVVAKQSSTATELAREDVAELTERFFGTPNEPRWPAEELSDPAAKALIDPESLLHSAGRVYSDEDNQHFGLYNEHCVTCHGIAGGGDGPASLLQNPYPRDFRAGIFKWKSTQRSAKPTRTDLLAILLHGAPGSGMPSFKRIADHDLQSLVDHVIYLSVRGDFERQMQRVAVEDLEYDEQRPDQELTLVSTSGSPAIGEPREIAREVLDEIVGEWLEANDQVVEVPPQPTIDEDSIARGKELFHGQVANCAGCHGPNGQGGMTTVDFDDWTKEFTTRLAITPTDREAVKPFRKAGALRPRQIHPRKLNQGVYRGGGDAETLYRRLVVGIAGTPMPGLVLSEQASPTGLTSDQVWDLVAYVRSLSGVVTASEGEMAP